jgi:two-component system, chemotaxis family, sensor kinase CheA
MTDPYRYFRIEARDLVEQLTTGVLELDRGADPGTVAGLLRAAHTLKGAARVVRQPDIADRTHAFEDAVAALRDAPDEVPADGTAHLLTMVDAIAAAVATLPGAPTSPAAPASTRPTASISAADAPVVVRTDAADVDDLLDAIAAAQAHLLPLRRSFAELDRIRRGLELLMAQLDGAGARGPVDRTGTDERVRAVATGLRDDLADVNRALKRSLEYGERELHQIRSGAEHLRLVPAGSVFAALHRAVRDAATATGVHVVFDATGGNTRVDPAVLSTVYGALLHVVRNAVAHGIEPGPHREAAGKPAEGSVGLDVTRRGTQVVFSCHDDGRGVDVDAVRAAAVRTGIPAAEVAAMSTPELMERVLRGGISTSAAVTQLSGRGVGLDAVRDAALRVGGQVRLDSVPGHGATVEITVPLSLLSIDCLMVEAAGTTAAVPLDAVRRCVRLSDAELARSATSTTIRSEDRAVPLLPLTALFKPDEPAAVPAAAVIVAASGGTAAVGVDRILGTAAVVVHALPALASAGAAVGGLLLDGHGDPRVVLDPAGLVAAAELAGRAGWASRERIARPPVLVIDDSLTTRMLERSILESAGYEVDLAASGEQALEMAHATSYGLFLVDVEMPGMDGFTFIEQARADPRLQHIPSILVSSRASPADRERGVQAGAAMHVAKGAFSQNELLDHIGRLVS